MFYTFVQNNSGGRYVGPECVCVEGNSLTEVEHDRVFWRLTGQDADALNRTRFRKMLERARRINSDIPLWESSRHPDAFWNIPAMRDCLGSYFTYANRV